MKSIKILGLVLLVVLMVGAVVLAQGKFTYTSGFQVQNLESTDANISVTYYNPDGSVDATATDTIPGSSSKTYFPVGASDGFNGSVVVSSDKQVGAVVNVLGTSPSAASASYVGTSVGSTTVQLPLLMQGNSGFDTWFSVQNTGSSDANVTINYSDGTSATATIATGASTSFYQATETHNSAIFSAIITSDQPVAATVMEESSSVMFAYSGFPAGSTTPVMPLVNANNAGYITGIQILNGGSASTDVTLSYTPSDAGTACTETQTIPAGQSATFALFAFADSSAQANTTTTCVANERFVGSAKVTSNTANQELTAIVNQLKPGVDGEAYGAFDPANATDTVVLPLIMDRNSGFFTGFNLMNVGSSTSVNCTFTGSSVTVSQTLNTDEALTAIQLNALADGYVGSATCTAGAGGKLLAVVNEVKSGTTDNLLVYEGISQ